jgi:hypothetical protein
MSEKSSDYICTECGTRRSYSGCPNRSCPHHAVEPNIPDLNAIKSRLKQITQGKWRYVGFNGTHILDDNGRCIADLPRPHGMSDLEGVANSKFIASAPETIASLVAEVERLQRLLGHYQQAINKIDDYFEYRNESKKDRDKVHGILESLTAEMKKGEV